MKKLISIIMLISTLLLLFTGCGKINVEKSVEALKAKGLREGAVYETDEDLEMANELFNATIEYWEGDFTVKVKSYTSLMSDMDFGKTVEFITFATKREAKAYTELYIEARDEYSDTKIAQSGAVVVITNLDLAVEALDVDFK
jgi:hypothetical protein